MIKQTISFEDFNGNPVVETLYFNLSKTELTDDLEEMIARFESLRDMMTQEHELSQAEVKQVLQLIKDLIKRSFGIKSLDGRRFIKTDEIWTEFSQSAAYDAFLFSLFEDPEKAVNFMTSVFPSDLINAASKQLELDGVPVVYKKGENVQKVVEGYKSVEDVSLPEPPKQQKYEDFTQSELLAMPQDQFESLLPGTKAQWSKEQLLLAMNRKSVGQ